MRDEPDGCSDCGKEMEPATIPGGGLIGWFCLKCDRFRPHTRDISFNPNSVVD